MLPINQKIEKNSKNSLKMCGKLTIILGWEAPDDRNMLSENFWSPDRPTVVWSNQTGIVDKAVSGLLVVESFK